ncbi:MAG: hypothetical protein ACFFG0_27645 [Candidatus Thorarchaeota archaeon]
MDITGDGNIIKESDPEFQSLLFTMTEEYNRVRENIEYGEIRDEPNMFKGERISYPNFGDGYGQHDVMTYHPELIDKLTSLLPKTDSELTIYMELDYTANIIELNDFYSKIFEETFPYYLYWNSEFPKKVLSCINGWNKAIDEGMIPIEIIVPMKGFYLPKERKDQIYNIILFENMNVSLSIRTIPEFTLLQKTPLFFGKDHLAFIGKPGRLAYYGIYAKGNIPFSIDDYPENFSQCYLWNYITYAVQAISLEGTMLRFGTPFYKFPWWISRHLWSQFKFNHPYWMSERYFGHSWAPGLVPDIGHDETKYYKMSKTVEQEKMFPDPVRIDKIVKTINPPNRDDQIIRERVKDTLFERFYESFPFDRKPTISNPDKIETLFKKLMEPTSALNFENQYFILDRLVKLGQQHQIEDVILNTSLILEAIFSGNDKELKFYVLKQRIANLLANNWKEFWNQVKFYELINDVRNAIIHGDIEWRNNEYVKLIQKRYIKQFPDFSAEELKYTFFVENAIQIDLFSRIAFILREILNRKIDFPSEFGKADYMKFNINKK